MGAKYQIIQGDCVRELGRFEDMADLILTSPPYDNQRAYGGHGFCFDPVADACVAALKQGGVLVWVVADGWRDSSKTGTSFRHALGFMDRGLKLHDTMIWQKGNPAPVVLPHRYIPAWDFMFVFVKGQITKSCLLTKPNMFPGQRKRQPTHRGGDRIGRWNDTPTRKEGTRHNVWTYLVGNKGKIYAPDFPEAHEHTSIFPYGLASDHIQSWTQRGDLVIDPMAGSGTTVSAAVALGRDAVGIDIHPPYCDLMERRMAQRKLEL